MKRIAADDIAHMFQIILSSELKAQSENEMLLFPHYKAFGTDGNYYEGHIYENSEVEATSLWWFERSDNNAIWEIVLQEIQPETLERIR